MVHKFVRL